ncbi:MAG: PEGA domain-containing protein [Candidatus Cloacimonetes bacterium]|nr:PEGA domain-containing protein [Candidatus Cloacimonadota bacterium]
MKIKSFLLSAFFLFAGILYAKEFSILEYRALPSDFTAERELVKDIDYNYCAALKVETVKPAAINLLEKTYRVDKTTGNETYIFFSSSENKLTIKSPGYSDLVINPPEKAFEPAAVYYIRLDTIEEVDLTINVTPADAEILINGKIWDRPMQKIVPGNYNINISKEGYEPISEEIVVSDISTVHNFNLSQIKIVKETVAIDEKEKEEQPIANDLGLPTLQAYQYDFNILSCEATHDEKVIIKIRITNLSEDDREIGIKNTTRFFDDQGREFKVTSREMGNKKETYWELKTQMISGIPTLLTLVFDNVPRSANSISLLELTETEWTLKFRTFPISRM